MAHTIQLLRVIRSAYEGQAALSLSDSDLLVLHRFSIKNRMPMLYLEAITEGHKRLLLKSAYERELVKYSITLDAISRVSLLLAKNGIKHAVFKTVRPYTSTTVDIDTLIFGGMADYAKSIEAMQKAGYKLIVKGPRSATLKDQKARIGIDLYNQVAVSYIIYIDKEKLTDHVRETILPGGGSVYTLQPEADLVSIIAHSILKEQMYTISEYYTFLCYLEKMRIETFIELAKQLNVASAVRTHATITAVLHKMAHGTVPRQLAQIIKILGIQNLETERLTQEEFDTPHKYHPLTIAASFWEIARGRQSRDSMAFQIYQLGNIGFSRKFLKALMEHIFRKTY